MLACSHRRNVRVFDTRMMGISGLTGVFLIEGPEPVLVDAGTAQCATSLVAWLRDLGVAPRYVVVTHAHHDHIGALGALQRAFGPGGAEVVATEEAAARLRDPDEVNRMYGIEGLEPVDKVRIVRDGEELVVSDTRLRFFETPGHSLDSLSVYDVGSSTLLVGDLPGDLVWGGTFVPPNATADFDEDAYRRSMSRMMGVGASCVGLSHFGLFEGPDAAKVLVDQLDRYERWKASMLSAYARRRSVDDVAAWMSGEMAGSPLGAVDGFDAVMAALARWCMTGLRSAGRVGPEA